MAVGFGGCIYREKDEMISAYHREIISKGSPTHQSCYWAVIQPWPLRIARTTNTSDAIPIHRRRAACWPIIRRVTSLGHDDAE